MTDEQAKEQKKRRTRFEIRADLTNQEEQQQFESLVAMSGLPKAEYIRRCCLDKEIKVVPQEHLNLYAQLGEIQVAMNDVCEKIRSNEAQENKGQADAELPAQAEAVISLLSERIRNIKELRGLLLGIELEAPTTNT